MDRNRALTSRQDTVDSTLLSHRAALAGTAANEERPLNGALSQTAQRLICVGKTLMVIGGLMAGVGLALAVSGVCLPGGVALLVVGGFCCVLGLALVKHAHTLPLAPAEGPAPPTRADLLQTEIDLLRAQIERDKLESQETLVAYRERSQHILEETTQGLKRQLEEQQQETIRIQQHSDAQAQEIQTLKTELSNTQQQLLDLKHNSEREIEEEKRKADFARDGFKQALDRCRQLEARNKDLTQTAEEAEDKIKRKAQEEEHKTHQKQEELNRLAQEKQEQEERLRAQHNQLTHLESVNEQQRRELATVGNENATLKERVNGNDVIITALRTEIRRLGELENTHRGGGFFGRRSQSVGATAGGDAYLTQLDTIEHQKHQIEHQEHQIEGLKTQVETLKTQLEALAEAPSSTLLNQQEKQQLEDEIHQQRILRARLEQQIRELTEDNQILTQALEEGNEDEGEEIRPDLTVSEDDSLAKDEADGAAPPQGGEEEEDEDDIMPLGAEAAWPPRRGPGSSVSTWTRMSSYEKREKAELLTEIRHLKSALRKLQMQTAAVTDPLERHINRLTIEVRQQNQTITAQEREISSLTRTVSDLQLLLSIKNAALESRPENPFNAGGAVGGAVGGGGAGAGAGGGGAGGGAGAGGAVGGAVGGGGTNPILGSTNPFDGDDDPILGSTNPFDGDDDPILGSTNPFDGDDDDPVLGSTNPFDGNDDSSLGSNNPFAE